MTTFKRFRITKAPTSPVRINVNGKPAAFPLGLEHDLDSVPGLTRQEILGALDGSNIEYELVGEGSAPAVDALAEAGGVGGREITAPSAESAPGNEADTLHGVISGPSADSAKGEDVEGAEEDVLKFGGTRAFGGTQDEQTPPPTEEPASNREELLSILDGNTGEVEDALDGLSPSELATLYAAEKDGNSRKGVIAALEAAIEEAGKGDDA